MDLKIARSESQRLDLCLELSGLYSAGGWIKAREIGRGIPVATKRQILARLVHLGLARARAGRAGGYRLARSPESISLWDILAPHEADLSAVTAGSALAAAAEQFRSAMRQTTLASIGDGAACPPGGLAAVTTWAATGKVTGGDS